MHPDYALGKPGIYAFASVDEGDIKPYVGRSNNIRRRTLGHIRRGKPKDGAAFYLVEISEKALKGINASLRLSEKKLLSLGDIEQLFIKDCGTPGAKGGGTLANAINARNSDRRKFLEGLRDAVGGW